MDAATNSTATFGRFTSVGVDGFIGWNPTGRIVKTDPADSFIGWNPTGR